MVTGSNLLFSFFSNFISISIKCGYGFVTQVKVIGSDCLIENGAIIKEAFGPVEAKLRRCEAQPTRGTV